uniref:Uncharacterized protein n=1 Tax=Anaerobacillus isosaccharinicus TaxID=1532552 RepID=A0A1S2LQ20_9BACI
MPLFHYFEGIFRCFQTNIGTCVLAKGTFEGIPEIEYSMSYNSSKKNRESHALGFSSLFYCP